MRLLLVLLLATQVHAHSIIGGESDTSMTDWWEFQAANCVLTTAQTDWTYSGNDVPLATCVTGGSFVKKGVLAFNDGTGTNIAQPAIERVIMLPGPVTPGTTMASYLTNAAITVNLLWYGTDINVGHTTSWCAQVICRGNGEADDGSAYDAVVCVNDPSLGTTVLLNLTQIVLPTASTDTCAPNELLHLKIYRDSDNATNDTTVGDANLEAVTVAWQRFQ